MQPTRKKMSEYSLACVFALYHQCADLGKIAILENATLNCGVFVRNRDKLCVGNIRSIS